jgi:drug/metabolite transporter (DMT)-like permease
MAFYLLSNIVLATAIFLLFKWFRINGIDSGKAIALNYLTVVGLGLMSDGIQTEIFSDTPALFSTLATGAMFILVFNIMAFTSQRSGVMIASIASKMSVVIPVVSGILLYSESAGYLKITGVVLALLAIIMVSWSGNQFAHRKGLLVLILPGLLFIGSGIVDSMLKYLQSAHMQTHSLNTLLIVSCGFAGITGIISLIFRKRSNGLEIDMKTLIYGLILGTVNYGSLFFLLKVLENSSIESGVAFSIINVSIVSLSAIFAHLLFKEKLSSGRVSGLITAVAAILILNLS